MDITYLWCIHAQHRGVVRVERLCQSQISLQAEVMTLWCLLILGFVFYFFLVVIYYEKQKRK